MKKRLLSTLLALCMVLALLPRTAWAADITYPVTGGSLSFDLTEGTITGHRGKITEAIIPDEINGFPVVSIGKNAFSNCSSLVSVTIPNSVTSIGTSAFLNCKSLTSITIPNGVATIEQYTFYGCSSLTSVTIPQSVTIIGERAFDKCSNLTNVYFGGSLYDWAALSLRSGNTP